MSDWPAGVTVRRDEPVSRHVPLRTGGPCAALLTVHQRAGLAGALDGCKAAGWKVLPIGFGTRMVVRDGAVQRALLRLGTDFARIERDGLSVTAGAAVPVAALVAATASFGAAGLSELIRVPGSVGGLLREEPDGAWANRVDVVTALVRGKEAELSLDEARRTRAVLTGARFILQPGDPDALRFAVAAGLAGRREQNLPAPGCTWQRFDKRSLRETLVKAGLAGVRLRGVTIPQHAPETLANLGGGTFHDLALLQRSAIDRVKRATGLVLASRLREVGARS